MGLFSSDVSFPDSERASEPVTTTSKLISNRFQFYVEVPANSPDNPKMYRNRDSNEEKKNAMSPNAMSPFALTQYTSTYDQEHGMQEEVITGSGLIRLLRVQEIDAKELEE